jgi:general secretion pathway protein C
MTARLFSFVIWAAVAAAVMFWGLRLFSVAPQAPDNVSTVAASTPRGDLSRLFGTPVTTSTPVVIPEAAGRFQLLGVVAPKDGARREGVALIAVDDKPARAYRVGAVVDGDWLLQGVHARGARLGPRDAPAQLNLELPLLPPPATGVIPPGGAAPPPAGVPPMMGVPPQVEPSMSPNVPAPPFNVPPPPGGAPAQTR